MADQNDSSEKSTETGSAGLRDSILSEMSGLTDEGESPPAPPAKEEPAEDPDAESDDDSDEDDADEDDAEPDDDEGDDEEAGAEEEQTADSDRDRRLGKIQKAEKRARDKAEQLKRRAERDIDAWKRAAEREIEEKLRVAKPHLDAAEAGAGISEKLDADPVSVFRERGYTGHDFERLARLFYAHSEAAQSDPKMRERAAELQREMAKEKASKRDSEETRKELQQLKAEIQAQKDERALSDYLEGVAKAVTDRAPLTQKLLVKAPSKTRNALRLVAEELLEETGKVPAHAAVVKEYETRRREEFEAMGGATSSPAGEPAKAKTKTRDANEKEVAMKTKNESPPNGSLDPRDLKAEILKGMQSLSE